MSNYIFALIHWLACILFLTCVHCLACVYHKSWVWPSIWYSSVGLDPLLTSLVILNQVRQVFTLGLGGKSGLASVLGRVLTLGLVFICQTSIHPMAQFHLLDLPLRLVVTLLFLIL